MSRSAASARWLYTAMCCVCLSAAATVHAATWHVSPAGRDDHNGAEAQPVATFARAVELATAAGGAAEIVLHAGVYPGDTTIPALESPDAPPLLVRAATGADGSFERVVIDGGQRVLEAQAVDAKRGIYFMRFYLRNYEPSMWEAQSRTRYVFAADRRSVEAFPGSLAPEADGVIFRTTDGQPPAAHELSIARDRYGLVIRRPNVTVRGLSFHNFQLHFGAYAISVEAPAITVEDCHGWNCYGLVGVSEKVPDATIRRCTARDVATGVKSYGRNTVVEDCRFFRIEDAFVVQENEQDQCGIQFYTSQVQTARGNLCVGFQLGIFIKASGGVLTLERNTVVGPAKTKGDRGLGPNKWRTGSVCVNNVAVGYSEPISYVSGLIEGVTISNNLVWSDDNQHLMKDALARIKEIAGGDNRVAAPKFADPEHEDYRLAPTSVGAALAKDGGAVGAMGAAPADLADRTPPTLELEVLGPARPLARRTQVLFRKNTWIGGGEPELIEDGLADPQQAVWLAPAGDITLNLHADDTLSAITHRRYRVGDGAWSPAAAFAPMLNVTLPEHAGVSTLSVQVEDGAGNWSLPATVRIATAVRRPSIVGTPAVTATKTGVVIAFQTDKPCLALVEWTTNARAGRATDPADIRFRFNNEMGLEWTERQTGPRLDHCIAITDIDGLDGTPFRIRLGYSQDDQHEVFTGAFQLGGGPRTLHVAPGGVDAETGGSPQHPFATVQFAVDRALPGDRVLLASGIYSEEVVVHHGGKPGLPIRIESAEPWGAVLDGRRERATAIWLNEVSHVQISGLEFRWYRDTGVLAHHSSDLLVEQCKFWDRHWVKGRPSSADGIVYFTCKNVAIDHNLFFALNSGFRVLETDNLRITNNTVSRCFHRVAAIAYSSPCLLRNNSLAFGGSYLLSLVLTDAQLAQFDSDYNNLAVMIRDDALALARKNGIHVPDDEVITREENTFFLGVSKALADLYCHNPDHSQDKSAEFPTITAWRETTGQDKHSLFVHPRYADPQNRDFRLAPGSPNIGAGEQGVNIGGMPVAGD